MTLWVTVQTFNSTRHCHELLSPHFLIGGAKMYGDEPAQRFQVEYFSGSLLWKANQSLNVSLFLSRTAFSMFVAVKIWTKKGQSRFRGSKQTPKMLLWWKKGQNLYVISCAKDNVIFLRVWKYQDVAVSDSLKFCFRFKHHKVRRLYSIALVGYFLNQVIDVWWLGYIIPREKKSS